MPTEESSLPEDELYPFDDETEDEAQRSAERSDSLDDGATEREVRIPPGEVVPPGQVLPDAEERIAGPREDEPEGGAGDSDIERGTR